MNYEVFVSHSSKNKALVTQFVELLQLGMGFSRDEIYCTSMNGTLPTGKEFIPAIKDAIEECKVVVFLLTPEFMDSKFCLSELGAAWALNQHIYPIVVPPLEVSCLDETPLKGVQALRLAGDKALMTLYGEWVNEGIVNAKGLPEFVDHVKRFMEKMEKSLNALNVSEKLCSQVEKAEIVSVDEKAPKLTAQSLQSAQPVLYADKDGYYTAKIVEERDPNKIPPTHRCYRIDGRPSGVDAKNGESFWLLYFSNRYPELEVGKQVRFKYSKLVKKHYIDVGECYDLYIKELLPE